MIHMLQVLKLVSFTHSNIWNDWRASETTHLSKKIPEIPDIKDCFQF